jgi:hypothetical protein
MWISILEKIRDLTTTPWDWEGNHAYYYSLGVNFDINKMNLFVK